MLEPCPGRRGASERRAQRHVGLAGEAEVSAAADPAARVRGLRLSAEDMYRAGQAHAARDGHLVRRAGRRRHRLRRARRDGDPAARGDARATGAPCRPSLPRGDLRSMPRMVALAMTAASHASHGAVQLHGFRGHRAQPALARLATRHATPDSPPAPAPSPSPSPSLSPGPSPSLAPILTLAAGRPSRTASTPSGEEAAGLLLATRRSALCGVGRGSEGSGWGQRRTPRRRGLFSGEPHPALAPPPSPRPHPHPPPHQVGSLPGVGGETRKRRARSAWRHAHSCSRCL